MKILITGANGQLGYWLQKVFEAEEVLATDVDSLDITNVLQVEQIINEFKPEVVVHGAAYTNVDKAETDKETAFLVNEIGTKNIVEASRKVGAKVVYVSTDYVFDGAKTEPYLEGDEPSPQSVYGESKLAGERAVLGGHRTQDLGLRSGERPDGNNLIVRTAWLYGENGRNFVETMLKLSGEKPELKVVNDQMGSPTYTKDLALAIKFLIEKDEKGIFHTVCSGECSWYDFAVKIFELSGKKVVVSPVSTAEFPRPAKRPAHGVLSTKKLENLGYKMRNWQEALGEYLRNRAG